MKRFSQLVPALCIGAFLLLQGCSKTEYEYEKRPYKNIETFALVGYAGDSINATINNGEIIIYWAAETNIPATIKPNIVVSPSATISPASGTEVVFSTATIYTVTAEDGSKQTYRLKPVINHAVPRISQISPNNLHWISGTQVNVSGEYFLSGDTADVHVYAERLSDGFEFDLPIDYTKLTMTNIVANLPEYSDILDTGVHKIRVKIGNRISDEKLVNIRMPDIDFSGLLHLTFENAGQQVSAGDSVTLKFWDDYNGNVSKWYAKKFTKLVIENYQFEANALIQTDSTIKFKIPDYPIDRQPASVILYHINPYYDLTYLAKILSWDAWPIIPVKQ
ncbi:IPT/TIG domain-containing protein [Chitinophaga sp. S165]|uniref:IPT/TIG domain-containing protein n=1 Tax=Chitinophaga sp. S165 TaxID=2135462 RepID=UPI000D83CD37|nr:IPT/TIG domain-containing protein [Chitinophaga sp. S165]PWV50792.1 hypothetical protein C7475_104422 [Chitinophaga sp. S165]